MVANSWFRSLWKTPRKHDASIEKAVIGVLAFEVASLMSKLVNLWQCLSDKQVAKLRGEISNSVGIKKLVSDDENFIVGLISVEMLENLSQVAKSVARLGKKCSDPSLKGFGNAFDEFIYIGIDPYGWQLTWKKMEKKVKKMEKFISTNASLYQEMEVLADFEQTLRRIKTTGESDGVNLTDFHKKVAWKRHEVKNLQNISLWNRTYDYTILLLARSLFTTFSRINHVFGIREMVDGSETNDSRDLNSEYIYHSQSVSALLQPSAHPSENSLPRFASGPLGGLIAKSGPMAKAKANKTSIFHSGPLGDSSTKWGPISGNKSSVKFYSGPLGRNLQRSAPVNQKNKSGKIWKFPGYTKKTHTRTSRLTQVGPFKGCIMAADGSSVSECYLSPNDVQMGTQNVHDASPSVVGCGKAVHYNQSVLCSKGKLLNPVPDTLGAAALALHYANVIIVIEKLAATPHLIGPDAREDLYNMLPTNVRSALRDKLKPCAKTMASSVYDPDLAEEWTEAMSRILEWLAPLAHNMIRWQSERSFEQQSFVSRTNVLLVQTLYFANQERTEATITELLVGLNYVWRYGQELNTKALAECASSRMFSEYLDLKG